MAVDPELTAVLEGAPHLYVAMRTKSGPNVTPELFTQSGGRIICMTSVATLKAKLLQRDPVVSIAARSGTRAVTVVGTVEVVDAASPRTIAQAPAVAAGSPLGVARFLRDNAAELAGAAVDTLAGRLGGPIPPRRLILAVTPRDAVVWDTPSLPDGAGDNSAPLDLGVLPDELAALPATGDAIAGWTRADGTPLALPVVWDHDRQEAVLPTSILRDFDAAPRSAACVTFDTWTGYGPSGKQGVMLRGTGTAEEDGATTRLRLDLDRATWWDGVETSSEPLTGTPVPPR